jgi:DNA-damage-inducible protein J
MATANITIQMDEELKTQAESLFSEIGMSLTAAFLNFVNASVQRKRIPYELATDPFYSEANMNRLKKAIADANAGRNMTEHELIEVDDD